MPRGDDEVLSFCTRQKICLYRLPPPYNLPPLALDFTPADVHGIEPSLPEMCLAIMPTKGSRIKDVKLDS